MKPEQTGPFWRETGAKTECMVVMSIYTICRQKVRRHSPSSITVQGRRGGHAGQSEQTGAKTERFRKERMKGYQDRRCEENIICGF